MDQQTSDFARLFELVSGIQIRARRTIEAGLRLRGLTYAQYTALLALNAHDGMSQAELAQALDTDSTTAMVLRTSLERKGYVARVDDPDDGRVKRIEISDTGKAALQAAGPEARSLYSKAGSLLSENELKKLLPALEKIHAFVGETSAPQKAANAEARRKGRPRKDAGARPASKTVGKAKATGKPSARGRPNLVKKTAKAGRPLAKTAGKTIKAAKLSAKAKAGSAGKTPAATTLRKPAKTLRAARPASPKAKK